MKQILLNQEDYRKLNDERGKLRFIISSFIKCEKYPTCDVNCYISLVEDDEKLDKLEKFAQKYNLCAEDVALLIDIFLTQRVRKYLGETGKMFIDLKEIMILYRLKKDTE